ncbi:PKD domain-containing protein [Pseudoalteromonas luteoviolacea]|uniref:PKD domain-containing protein n=1 Tax=Pseudoalteromonas luteoviolacea H33 TaxID=1365251 RepID=A0A167AE95_9GAMM|nr:PKD domain-containing protein [Pseudoalteromonas luteoviolacea]KZN45282.1 hypothetical protein N476_04525 [Pseudoalteromonas luteoviolacea H33]KZN70854.1 hypothetical protein N477_05515 [Pseudoalteromonas luteoviolacea H33-S]MBQ4877184.1 PKD domain-containing protein [Pseudoalteromonas luteoviolacea]MBQ4906045.1 PKD domain-containing protein [Pseudoalteromonas luteoviolacea]
MLLKRISLITCVLAFVIPTQLHAQEKTYFWDFGDGSTSTEASPNHTYTKPGIYTVSLTETVSDNLSYGKQYEINAITPVIESLNLIAPNDIHKGEKVRASIELNSEYDLALNYEWTLPNDLQLSGQQVEFTFEEAGKHTIHVAALFKGKHVFEQPYGIEVLAEIETQPKAISNPTENNANKESSSSGGAMYWLLIILGLLKIKRITNA